MAVVLSGRPFDAAALLADGERSLILQAGAVKGREQTGGWGAAQLRAGGEPRIVKGSKPVRLQKDLFRQAIAGPRRGLTLAHLRGAPDPLGLSAAGLSGAKNTQPYFGNGFIFAHNGALGIPAEIKTSLGKYESSVKSENGSETLFWQIMKMLDAYGDPAVALEMAIEEINTVWLSVKDRYPSKTAPYRGLNIFLSDGRDLWVLCHYPAGNKNRALPTPGRGAGRIAWRKDAGTIVFSSEPLDGGQWNRLANRQIARASLAGKGVTLKVRDISGGRE